MQIMCFQRRAAVGPDVVTHRIGNASHSSFLFIAIIFVALNSVVVNGDSSLQRNPRRRELLSDSQQVIGDGLGTYHFGLLMDGSKDDAAMAAQEIIQNSADGANQLLQAPVSPTGRPPAWFGRFDPVYKRSYFAPAIAQNTCAGKPGHQCRAIPGLNLSYPYEEYILDPTVKSNPQPVMKVHFPAGSISAGSAKPGGTLFFAYPFKWHPTKDQQNAFSHTNAYLEYEVYFPPDFDFVKGGKLPGMSGGKDNGRGCGGGADPDWCFNFRIMWREGGLGEAYLYVPENMQASDFCTRLQKCAGSKKANCIQCNYNAGVSWGRGAFYFKRGEWNTLRLGIGLNTPNTTDGTMEVWHNGRRAIYYDKINWRQKNAAVEAIEVVTFYGGSDSTWAPSTPQHLMFRNFRAWRADPPSKAKTLAAMSLSEQVVIDEDMGKYYI